MTAIEENVDLLPYNTFGISANARYFTTIKSVEQAKEIFASEIFKQNRTLILGGGSNLLLTGDFQGLVIKNEIKGINVINESDDGILLQVGAGENWHELVLYCVQHDYGGIENLSLIPGTSGA